jgi:hypothetical protein
MHSNRFLSAPSLAGLKDFQRNTVEYVFKRLYGDAPTSRFLIADEVGLGKTLVARGIIAKTLESLQNKVDRVDVIYICSNATIATQNVNRLNVGNTKGFSISTRLTYLPREVRSLRENKVNFISLTPGTAFDHARSRGGHADERAILYRMLYDLPLAQNERRRRLRKGLLNILQATTKKDNWRAKAKNISVEDLDADLSKEFRRAVRKDAELYETLKKGCELFAHYRAYSRIPQDDSELRYNLIGKLRSKLASVCLSALDPDLVILDEFQRFKHLLDGDDDASMLAAALFEHPNVRVLLLSATPYKMFTLDQEKDEDDHYSDFISTLNFLFSNDSAKVNEIKELLSEHRTALHACVKGSTCQSRENKAKLERSLLEVMCRTERIATTRDHNSMLIEIEQMTPPTPADLQHAATVDAVAMSVKAGETIEYWKSAPYLLNFLKHYELRRKLDDQLNAPSDAVRRTLSSAKGQLLKKDKLEDYQALDTANPRMRVLFKDTIDKGMWQLLWMPPSMPYIEPNGVYRDKDSLTKALVFSSWSAVPDAIASICSYEAERQMLAGTEIPYSELYDRITPLLRFAVTPNGNRLTGMPVIAWLLPSPTLATKIDPLKIALSLGSEPVDAKELRKEVKTICRSLIKTLPDAGQGARADKRWYWAAPILLDSRNKELLNWCKSDSGWVSATPDHEQDTRFKDHIDLLVRMAEGKIHLGPQPDDLADVLCDLAIAGPGVCALRALRRIGAELDTADPDILSAAARIAFGFRSLFNMPETIAMLRGSGDTYWRRTLQYGIDGNLQSVLDEYVHVLRESLGLQEHSQKKQVAGIAECIKSVLSLRTARIQIDEIKKSKRGFALDNFNTRCRFALRFGNIQEDDSNQALVRADSVRDAFNSPFRPFVLASTSIGQEGLDFHTWCHAVVHWNLPSNPVDLEQREGRVHRYKGHAVRKNIAELYGLPALSKAYVKGDPWQTLFQIATRDKPNGHSDLIPYWIFEGSSRVERRIPLLPYSKEVGKLKRLKQGLALYRMVFGQPRQEELLCSVSQNDNIKPVDWLEWVISLQPPTL